MLDKVTPLNKYKLLLCIWLTTFIWANTHNTGINTFCVETDKQVRIYGVPVTI